MKELIKATRNHKALVFIDLEGTQYSHEMIQIGATLATLNRDATIKEIGPSFSCFVKAHNPVGKIVTDLTGITQRKLDVDGVSYVDMQRKFRTFVGKYWDSCSFVHFAEHDLVILKTSQMMNEKTAQAAWTSHLCKNHFDFADFISRFVVSEKGDLLSLSRYLEKFGVDFAGKKHDAEADSYNLALLYKAFCDQKEVVKEEYKKRLTHLRKVPSSINRIFELFAEGKDVTHDDYERLIEETFE